MGDHSSVTHHPISGAASAAFGLSRHWNHSGLVAPCDKRGILRRIKKSV
jgi:hypothetical protein